MCGVAASLDDTHDKWKGIDIKDEDTKQDATLTSHHEYLVTTTAATMKQLHFLSRRKDV